MTERIRGQLFKAMISQEIGFFDKKSNSVGALCSKLSSDASNVQGVSQISNLALEFLCFVFKCVRLSS